MWRGSFSSSSSHSSALKTLSESFCLPAFSDNLFFTLSFPSAVSGGSTSFPQSGCGGFFPPGHHISSPSPSELFMLPHMDFPQLYCPLRIFRSLKDGRSQVCTLIWSASLPKKGFSLSFEAPTPSSALTTSQLYQRDGEEITFLFCCTSGINCKSHSLQTKSSHLSV